MVFYVHLLLRHLAGLCLNCHVSVSKKKERERERERETKKKRERKKNEQKRKRERVGVTHICYFGVSIDVKTGYMEGRTMKDN